jgi:hypothetical protein
MYGRVTGNVPGQLAVGLCAALPRRLAQHRAHLPWQHDTSASYFNIRLAAGPNGGERPVNDPGSGLADLDTRTSWMDPFPERDSSL